jgi:hypothetical protein
LKKKGLRCGCGKFNSEEAAPSIFENLVAREFERDGVRIIQYPCGGDELTIFKMKVALDFKVGDVGILSDAIYLGAIQDLLWRCFEFERLIE